MQNLLHCELEPINLIGYADQALCADEKIQCVIGLSKFSLIFMGIISVRKAAALMLSYFLGLELNLDPPVPCSRSEHSCRLRTVQIASSNVYLAMVRGLLRRERKRGVSSVPASASSSQHNFHATRNSDRLYKIALTSYDSFIIHHGR